MTTNTSPTVALTETAHRINEALKTQSPFRPFTGADRCDRCTGAAQSKFNFKAGHFMLCGSHMRSHLDALLAKEPVDFWIEPCELWSIKGVRFPKQGQVKTGG